MKCAFNSSVCKFTKIRFCNTKTQYTKRQSHSTHLIVMNRKSVYTDVWLAQYIHWMVQCKTIFGSFVVVYEKVNNFKMGLHSWSFLYYYMLMNSLQYTEASICIQTRTVAIFCYSIMNIIMKIKCIRRKILTSHIFLPKLL
jgi:hypothetical protein